jgi:hypothetical protein
MKIDDGGPAFPVGRPGFADSSSGLSLRDWFAGMAMQAFASRHDAPEEIVAEAAYKQADAMIAARRDGNE